ncbi:MAG: cadmium-translocating P-type ATPase [Bacteroidales bacterium]|nr:cadmium-translocating P-type ATPase [Bacteroidales bacterium]
MDKHHEHHHEHNHEHGESHEAVIKIAAASVLLIAAILVERLCPGLRTWQLLLIFMVPYLIAGAETLNEAAEGLMHGEALGEDFLMSIATIGAMGIGFLPGAETQFAEAVFVMLFFQVGELFEGIAEGKSRESVAHLMDIRPDTANVERNGEILTVSPESVEIGETIVIRPGDRIPMDGIVTEGSSSLDTVAITGESVPRSVRREDSVISGCVNLSGLLKVRVTKAFGESTASKILDLVENASSNKSSSEHFITRFARIYTPVVVVAALAVAFIPPMIAGWSVFPIWLYRALTFLIVSCPCALVLSVPLAFFGGIGGASRKGILVKGSNYLEALAAADTVVFDKTGTLTHGVFEVSTVHPEKIDADELLHLAAHVERYSTHPIAASLRNAYPQENDGCEVRDIEEIAGHGVRALVNGKTVCVGNAKMMKSMGIEWKDCGHVGTTIHVAMDGEYIGHIVISDRIKEDAKETVVALKESGIRRNVMLTGDHEAVARAVAENLGLDGYHAELLPADKVEKVEALLKELPEGRKLAFVGDGINDAPVLARADIGIAMGAMGSDAAIEAADIVLMDDKPSKIAQAVEIARKTIRIARENTIFAIGVKVLVLILAAFGLAAMWLAVFADVGVTFLAVLNSMRTLKN